MRAQGVPDRAQFLDAPGVRGTDSVGALVEDFGDELSPAVVESAENVFAERRQPDGALNDPHVRDRGQYPGETSAAD